MPCGAESNPELPVAFVPSFLLLKICKVLEEADYVVDFF